MNKPKPISHGTEAGYRNHFRRGVPMCEPCREAGRVARGIVDRRAHHLPMVRPEPFTPHANESWREHAACLNHDRLKPAAWDDTIEDIGENGVTRAKRVAAAVAVCLNECSVRVQCAADVDLTIDDGVRGGEDLREVRDLKKRGRSA